MIYDFADKQVECKGRYYIAPSADVIGMVTLEDNASIWFQSVVRADTDHIVIGENSNIQDGSILHTDEGIQLIVGANVTVGHSVALHGCRIGENSMVGMGAVILNGAVIGRNCLIAANALVPEGKEFPDNSLLMGSPAKVAREVSDKEKKMMQETIGIYTNRAEKYRNQVRPSDRPMAQG